MFTLGSHEVRVRPDGWTVETTDGSLAAHWEHTIAVTEDGPRILTLSATSTRPRRSGRSERSAWRHDGHRGRQGRACRPVAMSDTLLRSCAGSCPAIFSVTPAIGRVRAWDTQAST